MSGRPAKRRKAMAMASAGVPTIESLPPELLETIFGFLDVGTLCTARLVCAHFRTAASQLLHSVQLSVETLRSRRKTSLNNFPNLSRVTVFDVKEADLWMLARHPLAHAVTHVRAVECVRPGLRHGPIAAGSPLLPLPNLASLTVSSVKSAVNPFFPFPETLRELILGGSVSLQAANLVTGLTNLTCLQITVRERFEGVTALTALRRLDICSHLSVIPFVAELTLLTHLQFQGKCSKKEAHWDSLWATRRTFPDFSPVASLARLHRLVHLGFSAQSWKPGVSVAILEDRFLASVSTLTGLRSLDVGVSRWSGPFAFKTVHMTPFSQLTALRLRSDDPGVDASFLRRFKLKRLQDLSLSRGVQLAVDRVATLRKATGLTRLELWSMPVGGSGGRELGKALSRMSRLRSLSLGIPAVCDASPLRTPDAVRVTFSLQAIALLTELTALELRGRGVTTNADMGVCLGLKKLRVLRMEVDVDVPTPTPSDRITRESFFAVAKLPELRKLEIAGNLGILGGNLRDNVRARLHSERHAKGWPPLELNVLASL